MSDAMDRLTKSGGGLGRNQLRWLRENVASFAEAEQRVRKADENAARIRAQLGADKKRKTS